MLEILREAFLANFKIKIIGEDLEKLLDVNSKEHQGTIRLPPGKEPVRASER